MGKDFAALGVTETLRQELRRMGITEATPVQETVLPAIRGGKDVVVQAQTGTGKTLAFLLPILEKIKLKAPSVQALIVTPTRELTLQIASVAKALGEPLGVRALSLYGGQDVERQVQKIGQAPHIVVGTPGRLLDLIRRGALSIAHVNKIVLDEADQMLHMGFIDDVETLLRQAANDRQTMFFSATMPDRVRALTHRYSRAPQHILIRSDAVTLEGIEQIVVDTNEDTKLDQLCALVNAEQPYLAMVFCRTKERVSQVATELARRGYLVDELHGDLTQAKRKLVMQRFSAAKLQLLVATDIAARGLDIEGVTHVFNYDIPRDVETYIHRIGRTGRAGEKGKAVTFVNARQYDDLRRIEHGIRSSLQKQSATAKTRQKKRILLQKAEQDAKAKALLEQRAMRPQCGKSKSKSGVGETRARRVAQGKARKTKRR